MQKCNWLKPKTRNPTCRNDDTPWHVNKGSHGDLSSGRLVGRPSLHFSTSFSVAVVNAAALANNLLFFPIVIGIIVVDIFFWMRRFIDSEV